MISTYTIKSFENLIEIGTTLGRNWFRGQSKTYNDLTPGIFRKKYNSPMHEMFKPHQEFEQMMNFKRYAPSLIKPVPEDDDFLTWLFWIQHHNMPTRLLDWSENILVAAFFAVVSDPEEDGEIWTIFPEKLNSLLHFSGLALKNHSYVRFLSSEAFHNNPKILAKDMGIDDIPDKPLALVPPNLFPRMTAQMSVFTIHPNPKIGGQKIEDLLNEEKFITRYIIPKILKLDFEKHLSYIGINYRTLFPDLEGLAKYFAREERYFGWSQPAPPKFK